MDSVIDRIDIKNPSREDLTELSRELSRMRKQDIRDVDKERLVELSDVRIDETMPLRERILSYIKQIRNPYCYLSHGRTSRRENKAD